MAATRGCPRWFRYFLPAVGGLFAFFFVILLVRSNRTPYMRYYISINSFSGLDPPPTSSNKDLRPLDPRFNLTLSLASSRPGRRTCMGPYMYVEVSYRCFPLASSYASPLGLCFAAEEPLKLSEYARATGVRLPGHLMDSLLADRRRGREAFDVTLKKQPGGPRGGDKFLVASCGSRRVGDAVAECTFRRHTCP